MRKRVADDTRITHYALLLLIVLLAAVLRLTAVDWDSYKHYHPDERFITWVATTIEWPSDWATALNPHQSTFNPYYWSPEASSTGIVVEQDKPRRFAYGHLPLYLGVAATRLAEWLGPAVTPYLPAGWLLTRDLLNGAQRIEFNHLTAVTRALTALVDVATVGLVFVLGRRLYNPQVGLLAALFLALNVMHIQLAHFFAVDPYLTFFALAAVTSMVYAVRPAKNDQLPVNSDQLPVTSYRAGYAYLAAVCVGLAIGCKFAGILLVLPLALTFWLDRGRPLKRRLLRFLLALAVAAATFALTNPFALLDWTCEAVTPVGRLGPFQVPAINWRSCFLENVARQNAMVGGSQAFAFTRQYAGTTPYLYYVEMQIRWGMGPLLGAAGFLGLAWAVWKWVTGYWKLALGQPLITHHSSLITPSSLIPLSWCLPYFLSTGNFYVKFMRYLQPLTPFLMIYAAAFLLSWGQAAWRRAAVALVALTTGLYAWSFMGIYQQPHSWISASEWIYGHVEPGSFILNEQWDDPLPDNVWLDGKLRQRREYQASELTWLTGAGDQDNQAKLEANLTLLAEADYLILVSNRIYGVVPRLPADFPLSSQYHPLLFDGRLGYEVVYVNGRFPRLGDFYLKPDTFGWPGLRPPAAVQSYLAARPGVNWGRADESFLVYDQPLTIVFANTGRLTAAEMLALFQK
ncbi:MAG: phospholipid carrier-dependent glycosyltransferase [Chloroflexota bacterium]